MISRSMPSSYSRRGYSRGYSSAYISRPSYGYGYSPYMSSPFSTYATTDVPRVYGGGPGVISLSRGPSVFDLMFPLLLVFMVQNFFLTDFDIGGTSSSFLGGSSGTTTTSALGSGTSVVQLSVALEVSNRDDRNSILSVLDRFSRTANTDTRVGLQNLTSQVALEVLRRKSSIVSASSSHKHFKNRNKAVREFQNASVKERSKFETENSNTANSKYGTTSSTNNNKATMAVVTFVIAIDGDQTKLPNKINSVSDVEEALRRIASDAQVDDCLQNVEILWTPEDRSETLSVRDIVADYPKLRSV